MGNPITKTQRCAIYTRKSSEEGLEQEFNSLHAQREACEAYFLSQRHEGWEPLADHYDDGGFSGGNTDRPGLVRLRQDISQGLVDIVLVYKVDRLSRSLADFVQLVAFFDEHDVAFAAVTQQFNTSTSMGRLTLNVLLSFAQFELEVTGERIRDKISASKKKGMWMGGHVPLSYRVDDRNLVVNEEEADLVRLIFQRYLDAKNVRELNASLDHDGYTSAKRSGRKQTRFSRGALYTLLKNQIYIGQIAHKDERYPGAHEGLIASETWDRVQHCLKRNEKSYKSRNRHPSLLAGILFDDRGNPMSPTHTAKGSRRYRYYVSQALLQYRNDQVGSVQRIPARALEEVVVDELLDLFLDPLHLLVTLYLTEAASLMMEAVLAGASQLVTKWPQLSEIEKAGQLKQWCQRIDVASNQIRITLRVDDLRASVIGNTLPATNLTERLEIDVQLQRCGKEKRLIVSAIKPQQARDDSVAALQKGLLRALRWNQGLRSGKYQSMKEIAEGEGLAREYVNRLIKLASLSPDLMDRIVTGNVPVGLSLERLKEGIPLDWEEQKICFGISQ